MNEYSGYANVLQCYPISSNLDFVCVINPLILIKGVNKIMSDLISIVVPVYKVENYLSRCIDSILKQTYNCFELILVNDGSPDRCGEICDKYAKTDNRIKVIHKRNGGLSDARNVGITASTGKYITFIDSDDWVNERYLEVLYNLIKSRNADISICNFLRTSHENISINNAKRAIVYEYSNIDALEVLTGRFNVQMVIACGKLYKLELFEKIWFPVGKVHEDEFTTYKLLYKANKVVYSTEVLHYYWQREDSIMGAGFDIKNKINAIEALEERADFFEKIGRNTLRDRTYKSLFNIYELVNNNIHMFNDDISRSDFTHRFSEFILKLRGSEQSLKFKTYYEMYLVSPTLAKVIKRIYSSIRKISCNISSRIV